MMPGPQTPVDGRFHVAMKTPIERAVELAIGESDALRRQREWLAEENVRLKMELARLTEENDALRFSAEVWIRVYERQLTRANQAPVAAAELRRKARDEN
jgi:hypothetical protein